ncbi:MAG: hypothetical protein ACE5KZ_12125 [Candidatus Scalinduaceae bacterium]
MKIISVTGTASNVGKTTVASYILKRLSDSASKFDRQREQVVSERYGRVLQHIGETSYKSAESKFDLSHYDKTMCALKITVRHKGTCPRHTGCDTCDSDYEPFKILTDDAIIKEKGKDTDQFSSAGADKVVWLQTDSDVEQTGIESALACFNKNDTIIVEGNSFLRVQDADVSILVASPSVKKAKKSTKHLINKDKIDLIAINVHTKHTNKQIEECKEQLIDLGCRAPTFVINPYMEDGYPNQIFIDRIQGILS